MIFSISRRSHAVRPSKALTSAPAHTARHTQHAPASISTIANAAMGTDQIFLLLFTSSSWLILASVPTIPMCCFQCFVPFALWHPLHLRPKGSSDCPECLVPDNLPLQPPSFPSSVSSPLRGSLFLSLPLCSLSLGERARACPELAVGSGVTPSTSLPVTANATPKRSLPIHIPEKDTPLLNCCQRKTRALFKPFSELLPRQRPIPDLIPSQTPPHLHIVPFHIVPSPFMGGEPSFYPLSLGERARVRALKTTPPLYLPIMNLVPLRTTPILPPLVLRKYYAKTNFQPNIQPNNWQTSPPTVILNAAQHPSPCHSEHSAFPPLSF